MDTIFIVNATVLGLQIAWNIQRNTWECFLPNCFSIKTCLYGEYMQHFKEEKTNCPTYQPGNRENGLKFRKKTGTAHSIENISTPEDKNLRSIFRFPRNCMPHYLVPSMLYRHPCKWPFAYTFKENPYWWIKNYYKKSFVIFTWVYHY